MANTVNKVIDIALNEVGYLEKKSNSKLYDKKANAGFNNYTKYAYEIDTKYPNLYNGKKNGYAWCDMFVDWCFINAFGLDEAKKLLCQPNKSYGAGCSYSAEYYKRNGQFHKNNPIVGDQIFFCNSTKSKVVHTGLVYDVDYKYVYTIEGNTSSASGVVANGGAVEKKKYKLSYSRIHGYGRPKYDKQTLIESSTKDLLVVDGDWGKATTKACQKLLGTTQDGIVSGQSTSNKKYLLSVSTTSWEFTNKKSTGSSMIRALQRLIGADVDGQFGKKSVIALQKYLKNEGYYKGAIDGKCGKQTVKALQTFLNEN